MQPAGLAAVAAAKANGRWTALDVTETLAEPADLAAALDAVPAARAHWDDFPRSARRAILEWIGNAKNAATRQARVEGTASDAARGIRANQWRQPKRPATPDPAAGRAGGAPVRPDLLSAVCPVPASLSRWYWYAPPPSACPLSTQRI